jgi:hypothetical protein
MTLSENIKNGDLGHVSLHNEENRRINNLEIGLRPGDNIQGAIDSLPASGGAIYLSPGIYDLSSSLLGRGNIKLRGAGAISSVLRFTGCSGIICTGSFGGLAASYVTFEDLTLRGNYTSGTFGAYISGMSFVNFVRCGVHSFIDGVRLWNCVSGKIDSCRIMDNDNNGLSFDTIANAFAIVGTQSGSNNGWGVSVMGVLPSFVTDLSFQSCAFSGNRLGGMEIDHAARIGLMSCHFENNATINTGTGRGNFALPTIGRHIAIGLKTPIYKSKGISILNCGFNTALGSEGIGYDISLKMVKGVKISASNHVAGTTAALDQQVEAEQVDYDVTNVWH